MLRCVFINMLLLSIGASIIYMSLRKIMEMKLSATWRLRLTAVMMVLFLVPLWPMMRQAGINPLRQFHEVAIVQEIQVLDIAWNESNDGDDSNLYKPKIIDHMNWIKEILIKGVPVIWFSGAFLMAIIYFISYIRFKMALNSQLKKCLSQAHGNMLERCKTEQNIKSNVSLMKYELTNTPILIGLMHSVIVIPSHFEKMEPSKYIYAHELNHHKKKHLWLKLLAMVIRVLHWYNPISKTLMADIDILCELSCDEAVIDLYGEAEKFDYATTIVSTIESGFKTKTVLSSAMNGGERNTMKRLKNIMGYKQTSRKKATIFILGICAMSVLTSAVSYALSENWMGNETGVNQPIIEINPQKNLLSGDNEIKDGDAETAINWHFIWPTPNSDTVTAAFGKRMHPISKQVTEHTGVDIAGRKDDPIVAAAEGEVVVAGWDESLGYHITIKHDNTHATVYAHCSELLVAEGEQVKAGDQIAKIGSTGASTGPHLHFEVLIDGEAQNPMDYFNEKVHD